MRAYPTRGIPKSAFARSKPFLGFHHICPITSITSAFLTHLWRTSFSLVHPHSIRRGKEKTFELAAAPVLADALAHLHLQFISNAPEVRLAGVHVCDMGVPAHNSRGEVSTTGERS